MIPYLSLILPVAFLVILALFIPDAAAIPAIAWMLIGLNLVLSGAFVVIAFDEERRG